MKVVHVCFNATIKKKQDVKARRGNVHITDSLKGEGVGVLTPYLIVGETKKT